MKTTEIPRTKETNSLKVLILGREKAASEATVQYLRHCDHAATMAENLDDAMLVAEQLPPDVLVCDLNPESGQHRLDVVREIQRRFQSALIVISNYHGTEISKQFPEFQITTYLRKPISLRQLERSVSAVGTESEH